MGEQVKSNQTKTDNRFQSPEKPLQLIRLPDIKWEINKKSTKLNTIAR